MGVVKDKAVPAFVVVGYRQISGLVQPGKGLNVLYVIFAEIVGADAHVAQLRMRFFSRNFEILPLKVFQKRLCLKFFASNLFQQLRWFQTATPFVNIIP